MFSNESKFVIVLFALIVLSVSLTPFWHDLVLYRESSIATSIERFDAIALESACFDLLLKPTAYLAEKTLPVIAIIDERIVFSGEVNVFEGFSEFSGCIPVESLKDGDNLIELSVGRNRLFFHSIKGESSLFSELSIEKIEENKLFFSISDANNLGEPIIILLNEKPIKKVFLSGQNQSFVELIEFNEGENIITVSYAGISVSSFFNFVKPFEIPWFFGLFLLILMIFVLSGFVFAKFDLIEKFALSIAFTVILLIANGFVLNYLNFLSLFSFVGLFVLEIVFFVSAFWNNKSFNYEKIDFKKVHFVEWIGIFLLLLVIIVFHLFSSNHLTYWNGFYERNSNMIADSFSVPETDDLSYLGKPFAFAPGYFFFNAGLQWLTSFHNTQLFALILILADVLFFLGVLFLTKALNFAREKRVLVFVFSWFSLFILTAATLSPRHALAFAMFLVSLGFFIQKKNTVITGLLIGVAGFIQTPMLFAFPVFYLFVSRKIEFWKMLRAFFIGVSVLVFLYSPTLLLHGIPYEIEAQNWGYLINLPLLNTFLDIAPLAIFFVLFFLVDLFFKKVQLDGFAKKLGIVVILGLVIQLFLSYRWNILTALSFSLFIAYSIPAKLLLERHASHLFSILMIVTAGSLLISMSAFAIPSFAIDPFDYMKGNSSNSDIVLTDPLFGHGLAYISEKRVVADLAVEFANAQQLQDSYSFVKFGDRQILERYDVDWVFNQNDVINENVAANYPTKKPIEFIYLNKIYSNGFYYIHKVWK